MLVFQSSWEHITAGCERAGIEPGWLVELVGEINLYLPDDWRMTRSSNNFRIQIVADRTPALVGRSYRVGPNEILHIIDSIFLKGFHDKYDLAAATGRTRGKVNAGLKAKHPDAVAPNLYFIRPCPDDSITPLFARQYEKIMEDRNGKPVGDQFHRIHPLTKAGLDLAHFQWVRWTTNGDVKIVETTSSTFLSYHGKDYWQTPLLAEDGLRSDLDSYLKWYEAAFDHTGATPPQPAEKVPSPYEREYKFLIPRNGDDAHKAFKLIEEELKTALCRSKTGFTVSDDSDKRSQEQVDVYFDDKRLSLHAIGASFRLREKAGNIRVTLKKRLPASRGFSEEGFYERIEEEVVVTAGQKAALLAGEPVNVFPYRLLAYVAPHCSTMRPVLTVMNSRKILVLEDIDHRKVEVCFDRMVYESTDARHLPPESYFEVELESKGAPREKVRRLAGYLEEKLGLIASRQSKYERGISLLRTVTSRQDRTKDRTANHTEIDTEKRSVIIDTDCGVDDALALVLALRSPELEVKAITTVCGNVGVDRVIPNVFKVLHALGVSNPPPVARGADCPLVRDPVNAGSVHGADGLGDAGYVPGTPIPENSTVDPRPAWKVICDLAREHPKQITLITIGPLTNLALAIQNDPDAVHCLKEVIAMGGVFFNVGNICADAEFNVAADPEAAYKVVEFFRDLCLKIPIDEHGWDMRLPEKPTEEDFVCVCGYRNRDASDPKAVPLTFVGLDVTHQVILRRATLERALKARPENSILRFVRDISSKYMDFYCKNEGLPGCYLHDPLAVAYAINPAFLTIEKHIIRVETRGQFTSGVIFPDDRPTTNPAWRNPAEEVIGIARHVEREAFEEFFLRRLIEG